MQRDKILVSPNSPRIQTALLTGLWRYIVCFFEESHRKILKNIKINLRVCKNIEINFWSTGNNVFQMKNLQIIEIKENC